jgi:DNA polymerase-3 subunit delta'
MKFEEIKGQEKIINSLIQSVMDSRISHSQLFLGRQDSATFALAWAYSQFINCTNKQIFNENEPHGLKADSCGTCPSCVKYQALSHPDLHLFFPNAINEKLGVKTQPESYLYLNLFREFVAENKGFIELDNWYQKLDIGNRQGLINVRDAARIISNLSLKACEAEYKVTIIWCFDKLNSEAFNKLLKALEEPESKTLFLLITDDYQAILPTILSRCQLIKIPSLDDRFKPARFRNENDGVAEEFFVRWMRANFLVTRDISPVIELGEEFASWGRERHRVFFTMVSNIFRKAMNINLGVGESEDLTEIADEKFRNNFPSQITLQKLSKIYQFLEDTNFHIQRNANAKILFTDLSIKIGQTLTEKS